MLTRYDNVATVQLIKNKLKLVQLQQLPMLYHPKEVTSKEER